MNTKFFISGLVSSVALCGSLTQASAAQPKTLLDRLSPEVKELAEAINSNGQDAVCKKNVFFRASSGKNCSKKEYALMALVTCGNYSDKDGSFQASQCGGKIPTAVGSSIFPNFNPKKKLSPQEWQKGIDDAKDFLIRAAQSGNVSDAAALACATRENVKSRALTGALGQIAQAVCPKILGGPGQPQPSAPGLAPAPAPSTWQRAQPTKTKEEIKTKLKTEEITIDDLSRSLDELEQKVIQLAPQRQKGEAQLGPTELARARFDKNKQIELMTKQLEGIQKELAEVKADLPTYPEFQELFDELEIQEAVLESRLQKLKGK